MKGINKSAMENAGNGSCHTTAGAIHAQNILKKQTEWLDSKKEVGSTAKRIIPAIYNPTFALNGSKSFMI